MKNIYAAVSAAVLLVSSANAQQLAFPGAEGFGRFATGGRGCDVYHVTNLNDSGSGSLRDAVSQPNRMVVFDVSGIIKLKSRLIFSKNLTIAGQTAPGNGVVVYGNGVTFSSCDNIIVRHMRFRMGTGGTSGADAGGLANGKNMIFDHLSISWGLDENFSINWDNKGTEPTNITIQNSIIGQGILIHAMGGLMQTNGGVSILKNLYTDNKSRNPKVKGLNQFVNNVVYNWGSDGYILGGSAGDSWATIEDCYFIKGPNSSSPFSRATATFQLFQKGNMLDGNLDGQLNGVLAEQSDYGPAGFVDSYESFNGNRYPHPIITDQLTAEEAYNYVVAQAGASLPVRDEVDAYLIDELQSLGLRGQHITGESQNGIINNVGMFYRANPYQDTDRDGIPDFWEDANGLDKNNYEDGKQLREDGYSNLEYYINNITACIPFMKYPTAITASGVTTESLMLKWDNNEPHATSIHIEYSTDNENFETLEVVNPTTTTYNATALKEKTKYYFRLKAVGAELESCYSDVYNCTTKSAAGIPDVSSVVYPANDSKVKEYQNLSLKWSNETGFSGGWVYYDVFLGKEGAVMDLIAEGLKGITTIELQVEPLTTYQWQVNARNAYGTQEGDVWTFTTSEIPVRTKLLYMPFDEEGGDVAENRYEGFASASDFTPSWVGGVFNNCISFPGTPATQKMVQPSYEEIEIEADPFTIELWFKSKGGSGVDWYLLHKGSHTKNTSTGATGRWTGIQYKSGSLVFGVDDDVTKSTATVSASSYFNNEWTHLVCVRDTESKKLLVYLNGVLKASADDKTTNSIASIEDLVIGNCNVNFNTPFNGLIDELSIYNEVIPAEEVLNNYYSGLNSITSEVQLNADRIIVSPNPFADRIAIDGLTEGVNIISLYSNVGTMVKHVEIDGTVDMVASIETTDLPSGFYTLVVKNNSGVKTWKLVKSPR